MTAFWVPISFYVIYVCLQTPCIPPKSPIVLSNNTSNIIYLYLRLLGKYIMCVSITFCKSTKYLWLLFHIKILAKTSKDSNSPLHYTNHDYVIEMQITIQLSEHNLKTESSDHFTSRKKSKSFCTLVRSITYIK